MERSLEQNKKLHTLISLLKITPEEKEELVWQYSNSRTNSSKYLTMRECAELISNLEKISGNVTARSVIIHQKLLWRFYYTLRDKEYLPSITGDEAMTRLDNFCLKVWNIKASDMDDKGISKCLGIIRKWKNKKSSLCPV